MSLVSPCAGVVLAGGLSSRMGKPKAALEWRGTPLVSGISSLLARTLDGPIVVVRAPGQELPTLPDGVEIAEDARAGRGPLEGLAAGLRAAGERADRAFVSSTDLPLLQASFVRRVAAALRDGVDAAVPRCGGNAHPLAAAYRLTVLPPIERLLDSDRLRMSSLLDEIAVRWLDSGWLLADPALAADDPHLDSLLNLNEPADIPTALVALASRRQCA